MTDASQPRVARGTILPAGILAAALFALLAFAPFASASTPDPVASGNTTINLNKGLVKKLAAAQIGVFKISPGSVNVKKRLVKLPVSGGSMDPTTGLGTLTHKGGFKLTQGKQTVALKNLEINTSNKTLKGNVGKKKITIAKLVGFSFAREGFGVGVKANKLKVTGKAAKELNKALTPKGEKTEQVFKANQVIGSDTSASQPSTVAVVPTGNTALTLSKQAITDLATVGPEVAPGVFPFAVKLSLLPPAQLLGLSGEGTPIAGFPISGGTIGPTATAGLLQHTGGLELKQNLEALEANGAGQTTLTMNNIYLDLGTKAATVEVSIINPKTPKANLGNLGRSSIADIDLTGATITSDPANHTVSVQNGKATLQAVTAATLNAVFSEPVKGGEKFHAGNLLGTFSFTAQTQ